MACNAWIVFKKDSYYGEASIEGVFLCKEDADAFLGNRSESLDVYDDDARYSVKEAPLNPKGRLPQVTRYWECTISVPVDGSEHDVYHEGCWHFVNPPKSRVAISDDGERLQAIGYSCLSEADAEQEAKKLMPKVNTLLEVM